MISKSFQFSHTNWNPLIMARNAELFLLQFIVNLMLWENVTRKIYNFLQNILNWFPFFFCLHCLVMAHLTHLWQKNVQIFKLKMWFFAIANLMYQKRLFTNIKVRKNTLLIFKFKCWQTYKSFIVFQHLSYTFSP